MQQHIFTYKEILAMDKVPRLKLINSISGFKSANLIGTVNSDGHENLAVFSSVMHIGSNPPLLGCITRPESVPRHTYTNIKETGWYTINHVHSTIFKQAHQTSGKYREDISEFEKSGLTPFYSETCAAPYVEEAKVRIGLKLEEEHKIEANGTILLVGSVQELTLTDDFLMDDHTLDLQKADTVAISGIERYHSANELDKLDYVRVPDELSRGE